MDTANDGLRKSMPHSAEAELAVLGAMLFDKEAVLIAHELLRGDDFYRADYKVIFLGMTELFSESRPVDAVTLKDILEKQGLYEKVGGKNALAEVAANMTPSANVRYYAKIIKDGSLLRKLIKASGDITEKSLSGTEDADIVLDFAEKSIFDIARNRDAADFVHIKEALNETITKVEEAAKSGQSITGLSTGFADIDRLTAGLHPANLILIAARPSMGKTVLGLNIAQHVAIRKKITTAFFSLEMSRVELSNRILSAEARVEAQKLKTGELTPTDWENIASCIGPISQAPLYLDDTPGITIPEMRAKCRRLKLEKGLGLIVVDYIQLMNGTRRTENRQQEISEISRSLKAIAREMEVPLVALAQLSRAPETRAEKRPILSDLRESGAIEQDADIVGFIYRDDYYNKDTEHPGIAEIIIAKQRNGPTGTVELLFQGEYVRFANMAYN